MVSLRIIPASRRSARRPWVSWLAATSPLRYQSLAGLWPELVNDEVVELRVYWSVVPQQHQTCFLCWWRRPRTYFQTTSSPLWTLLLLGYKTCPLTFACSFLVNVNSALVCITWSLHTADHTIYMMASEAACVCALNMATKKKLPLHFIGSRNQVWWTHQLKLTWHWSAWWYSVIQSWTSPVRRW